MDLESRRDLDLLEAVAADRRITQRRLATQLGIALGLTNLYVQRLIRKGYIKCVNVRSNRLLYLITPRGVTEKARLTYEFMEYSVRLYRQMRGHLRGTIERLAEERREGIAIFGTGEAAELAYLSIREAGLEPVAIFVRPETAVPGKRFLGIPVRDVAGHANAHFDALIVATMEPPDALVAELIARGVPGEKLVTLRPPRARRADKPATGRNGLRRE
jgi:DNA-binding Lrp family transcriptional regulator